MRNRLTHILFVFLLLISVRLNAAPTLEDLLPMQEGFVVVTCSAGPNETFTAFDPNGPVVAIINTSDLEL